MNSEYRKGFVLTLLGVLIFTPDALLIRLTNLEFFSLTVGRGTIGGLAMLLGLALYTEGISRNRFWRSGVGAWYWPFFRDLLPGRFTRL